MRNNRLTLIICIIFIGFHTLFSQSNDKVFYSSFRPEGWDIYLSKDKGKTVTALTSHASLDYDAKISPDGNWIVFTSERNGTPQLFIKNIEGDTLPRLLVQSQSMQDQVDFAPDGQSIVFLSTHEGNAEIYQLPFRPHDTLEIAQAKNLSNNSGGDFRPRYSHDGMTIAFSSDRDHPIKPHSFFTFAMQRTGDIYSMSSQGGEAKRLTDSGAWDGSPAWSMDDTEIIFYSDRNSKPTLFKMSNSGENQEALSTNTSSFSPIVTSEENILFTSMDERSKAFSIVGLNTASGQVDSSLVQGFDMFNVDVHENGLMVFHGGEKPKEIAANKSGFEGDLLVKSSPEKAMLGEQELDLFGVRRAFAAPPSVKSSEIVYDASEIQGPFDLITPFAFLLALLPLLAIFWFFLGIVQSIRRRKSIPFWKYLLFAFVSLGLFAIMMMQLFSNLVQQTRPLHEVRWFALIMAVVLLIFLLISYRIYRRRQSQEKMVAMVSHSYMFMFGSFAIMMGYMALLLPSFFDIPIDFYSVNYETNEVKHLFKFEAENDLNPILTRVIDTKFTPDGKHIQFSVGGFRADAGAQGAVYQYSLDEKTLNQLTDFDSNNGFADFSKDNATMIFRSGRTGTMDVFIKENETYTNLSNSPAKENFPVISHDGNYIAYCSDVNGTDIDGKVRTMDIFVSSRNEDNSWSTPKQLTNYTGQEGHPHFSPDGKWLIYTSEEFGINDEQPLVQNYLFSPQMYGEITAIRIEDGEKIRLTHNKWEDGAPLWISAN